MPHTADDALPAEKHAKVIASRARRPVNLRRARYCTGTCVDGTPCTRLARRGRPYCARHGGNVPVGIAHPGFKHGIDSRYHLAPSLLADAYEAARNDPKLLELTEHIALADAKLKSLVRDMSDVWRATGHGNDRPDPRPDWVRLRDGWADYMAARTPQAKALAQARLGALINAGAQTDRLTAEFAVLSETLRRLVETQTRRDEKLGQFVPADQVRALVRGFVETAKRHIADPAALMAFQRDIAELFGRHPSRPAKSASRGLGFAKDPDFSGSHSLAQSGVIQETVQR